MFNWLRRILIKVFNRTSDKSLEPANDFADWAETQPVPDKIEDVPPYRVVWEIRNAKKKKGKKKTSEKSRSGSQKKSASKKKKTSKTKRG